MEDLTTLVWFSLAMFVGSYMAGLLPLAFSMSQSRMRLVTIFGAGLLVGTALCVIVPEGVETLYDAKQDAYDVKSRIAEAESILRDPGKMIDKPRILPRNSRLFHRNKTEVSEFTERRKRAKGKTDKNRRIVRHISPIFLQQPPLNADSTGAYHADDVRAPLKSENTNEKGIDQSIGLPLICGFVFMLMVDQFTRSAQGKGPDRSRFKITATLGLVVHAAGKQYA
ncbi:hypothetical protein AB6A40_009378 [Gnathostoma spinigerum]|uniref:Uncharacterized protein n=1 Tax=Gnathostoma spinigerum TaxID=75299 RepID=A0ABD6EZF1_9BILA